MSNTAQLIKEGIEQIENLGPVLDLTAFVSTVHKENIEYKMEEEGPKCIGYPLFNDGNVGVQLIFMEKGAVFPRHIHKATEWLIVYAGKLQFFNGVYQGRILNKGGSITIAPTTSHRVKAMIESWMVAITIPAASGYPK